MNKKGLLHLSFICLLLGMACRLTAPDTTPMLEATPTWEATPMPAIMADCFWSATAVAWLDEDADGLWDDSEPPLAGIEFVLDPSVYSRSTSDETGRARITAVTPVGGDTNCDELLAELAPSVFPVRFTGYELTTAPSMAYESAETIYEFGFRPVPGS